MLEKVCAAAGFMAAILGIFSIIAAGYNEAWREASAREAHDLKLLKVARLKLEAADAEAESLYAEAAELYATAAEEQTREAQDFWGRACQLYLRNKDLDNAEWALRKVQASADTESGVAEAYRLEKLFKKAKAAADPEEAARE